MHALMIVAGILIGLTVSVLVASIFGQAIHHHMNATAHEIPERE